MPFAQRQSPIARVAKHIMASQLPTKLHLQIISTVRSVVNAQVDEVEIPGAEGYFGVLPGHTPLLALLGTGEMIHWSERDGWGHYYLFDPNGTLKAQLTSGEFVCSEIEAVDEKARILYFSANGREPEGPIFHSYV